MNGSDDTPGLAVGFGIDFGESFGALKTMDDIIGKTAADAVREFEKVNRASSGMFSGATAKVSTFGNDATSELRKLRLATNQAENAGEAMVRQLEKQASTFGKTRSEIRDMRAELRAADADARGLTELAGRIRAAAGNLKTLEAGQKNATGASNAQRASMQNLGFQLQDFSVQVVGGTSVLRAFAMQAPQAAGALNGFGGSLGKVGSFLAGPWGIALTLATTLGAGLAESLWNGAKAADANKAAKSGLKDAIDRLNGSAAALNHTTRLGTIADMNAAEATRQLEIRKRGLLDVLLREQQAKLASARATENTSGGTVPGAGVIGYGAASMEREVRATQDAIKLNSSRQMEAQNAIVKARGFLIRRDVEGATDAATAATQRYEDATDRLQRRYEAGKISERAYRNELMGATRARDAATQAIKDAEKAETAAGRAARQAHAKELREQAKAAREAAAAQKELQGAFEGMEGRFDAVAAASRQYGKDLAEIAKFRGAGLIDANTADAWTFAASRDAAERAKKSVAEFKGELENLPELKTIDVEVKGLDKLLGMKFDVFAELSRDADNAANAMSRAFGGVANSVGDALSILADYSAQQDRIDKAGLTREQAMTESAKLRLTHTTALAGAAKGMFAENSRGYAAMAAAEKVLTLAQLARTAVDVAGGAARMFASLGPLGFPAVAAMIGVMAALGFSGGGSSAKLPTNTGTGTVLGDGSAKSESIKRAIDDLKSVDTLMLGTSREMAASLRSIEGQIGGVAAQIVRAGNVNASAGMAEGFKTNAVGSVLKAIVPVFGGALASLFGTKTAVTGSGLYAGSQTVGSILGSGFDASTYSDIEKTKKFLGITTGKSRSTQYSAADAGLEGQFTLIFRSFNDAIVAAAKPLGESAAAVQAQLSGFAVNLGKIDLQGLTGTQIEEKLSAVFGAAADNMANAAFPGFTRFQKVGEGAFETLVRVSSTVETVTASLDQLGASTRTLGVDAKMGLAGQFDSLSAMSSAIGAYATAFYTKEEQAAAQTARMQSAFASLGMVMPGTIAAFRSLVEAQDLTTSAGQSAYATLIQMGPAFAELKSAMDGAKSAADVLAERQDLERRILELRGDTAAIRALDLAKLDASNRDLQQQIWAIEAAQEAAKAAEELQQAWKAVGTSIMDEVQRIRGVTEQGSGAGFAVLQGQFNAALNRARAGDMDVARTLPALSQSLLSAAGNVATSRQELDRVRAQTASQLEGLYAALNPYAGTASAGQGAQVQQSAVASTAASGAGSSGVADMAADLRALREEVEAMRRESVSSLTETASNTRRISRTLENVTNATGGDAISVVNAA